MKHIHQIEPTIRIKAVKQRDSRWKYLLQIKKLRYWFWGHHWQTIFNVDKDEFRSFNSAKDRLMNAYSKYIQHQEVNQEPFKF